MNLTTSVPQNMAGDDVRPAGAVVCGNCTPVRRQSHGILGFKGPG
jgi:hypothetical protein